MFNNEIVSSDKFLDMAISTQCLYFHLCMNADDDWFVSPKRIMRIIWSTDDELKILAMKWFVLAFNDWVIIITHWKLNNNEIKLDRYNKTIYQEHLKTLTQYNKVYALELVGVQNVVQMEDQSRVDKSRLDKIRIEKKREEYWKFVKLSPEEFEKLKQRFTEVLVLNIIEKIENRITNKKKWKSPYIDYYQTIINRAKKDIKPIKELTELQIWQLWERRYTPEWQELIKQHQAQLDKYTPDQLKDLRKKALLHFVQNA
jgi:hypothetical protein